MRGLMSLNPANELQFMSDLMDRFMESVPAASNNQWSGGVVPIDIYERDNHLYIRAAVPGVNPEEIEVNVEDQVLTIRGEWKSDWASDENTKVYLREFRHGAFTRSIRLPEGVLDLNNVDATFENGFLTISLPKLIKQKNQRSITVRTGPSEPVRQKEAQAIEQKATNGQREKAASR